MRYNFGKVQEVLETPQLTVVQRRAYDEFLNKGIGDLLRDFSPVKDYNDNLYLHFDKYVLSEPAMSSRDAAIKGQTYCSRLVVTCRLENRMTGEIQESDVCFGEIPIMANDDSFIVNGIERTIVSQLVRSPGIYYTVDKKVAAFKKVEGLVIPNNGAWLEMLNDQNDVIFVVINKQKKILITPFLRVLGLSEDEIKELLTERYYEIALNKDKNVDYKDSLKEVFEKTRPGEPFSEENAKNLIQHLYYSPERYSLREVGRYKVNNKTGLDLPLDTDVLTMEDIVEYVRGFVKVLSGQAEVDDIDHLGNRRIRTVGELAEEKFRSGMNKMVRSIKEQISVKGTDNSTPSNIINPRLLQSAILEFFVKDQLSQMVESTNALSSTTNKRRVSAIGKGGVNKDRAGMEVRDVHYTHYGRLDSIETPDGANIGLITSLALYADIDKYGFIVTPYLKVDKKKRKITKEVVYLNASDEDRYYVGQVDIETDKKGVILEDFVKARHKGETLLINSDNLDFVDVSTLQTMSISASLIPFLHNDDATRAGMGCNMQRQAVPLMEAESPLIGTGAEAIMGKEYTQFSDVSGVVTYVDASRIVIENSSLENKEPTVKEFLLSNFTGTKKNTCVRETPIVSLGQKIEIGDPLYYRFCVDSRNGELSLGRNLLVAYMPYDGYNYEDSILINDRLIKEDVLTSLHIEKVETDARATKLGHEQFTRDLMGVSSEQLERLDENGFIKIGSRVKPGDFLIGKVTPKGEKELTPEEKLVKAVLGNKTGEVRNTSLKVANGDWGTVAKIKRFTPDDNIDLGAGVNEKVQVTIAKKRKIQPGDKMAGRHGNKGVVSRIVPSYEMPYLPDGRPIDIALNPLGVPSRMNIGQVLENHLGFAAEKLGVSYAIPVFDGPTEQDIKNELKKAGLPETGKSVLYDGRTGEPFDNEVTVGITYMLRLGHLVDEKIHGRSTGSYSLITQQPLGGKAQFGGQRFGEMEVWALEAHGAANTLQEMLTIKSDDVKGRENTAKALLSGQEPPSPRLPESYKVLDRQLNGIAIKCVINGRDDVTLSDEEDLKEERYVLDGEINQLIKPWKAKNTGKGSDEDEDDDDEEDIDCSEFDEDDSVLENETGKRDVETNVEYLEEDEVSDIE